MNQGFLFLPNGIRGTKLLISFFAYAVFAFCLEQIMRRLCNINIDSCWVYIDGTF